MNYSSWVRIHGTQPLRWGLAYDYVVKKILTNENTNLATLYKDLENIVQQECGLAKYLLSKISQRDLLVVEHQNAIINACKASPDFLLWALRQTKLKILLMNNKNDICKNLKSIIEKDNKSIEAVLHFFSYFSTEDFKNNETYIADACARSEKFIVKLLNNRSFKRYVKNQFIQSTNAASNWLRFVQCDYQRHAEITKAKLLEHTLHPSEAYVNEIKSLLDKKELDIYTKDLNYHDFIIARVMCLANGKKLRDKIKSEPAQAETFVNHAETLGQVEYAFMLNQTRTDPNCSYLVNKLIEADTKLLAIHRLAMVTYPSPDTVYTSKIFSHNPKFDEYVAEILLKTSSATINHQLPEKNMCSPPNEAESLSISEARKRFDCLLKHSLMSDMEAVSVILKSINDPLLGELPKFVNLNKNDDEMFAKMILAKQSTKKLCKFFDPVLEAMVRSQGSFRREAYLKISKKFFPKWWPFSPKRSLSSDQLTSLAILCSEEQSNSKNKILSEKLIRQIFAKSKIRSSLYRKFTAENWLRLLHYNVPGVFELVQSDTKIQQLIQRSLLVCHDEETSNGSISQQIIVKSYAKTMYNQFQNMYAAVAPDLEPSRESELFNELRVKTKENNQLLQAAEFCLNKSDVDVDQWINTIHDQFLHEHFLTTKLTADDVESAIEPHAESESHSGSSDIALQKLNKSRNAPNDEQRDLAKLLNCTPVDNLSAAISTFHHNREAVSTHSRLTAVATPQDQVMAEPSGGGKVMSSTPRVLDAKYGYHHGTDDGSFDGRQKKVATQLNFPNDNHNQQPCFVSMDLPLKSIEGSQGYLHYFEEHHDSECLSEICDFDSDFSDQLKHADAEVQVISSTEFDIHSIKQFIIFATAQAIYQQYSNEGIFDRADFVRSCPNREKLLEFVGSIIFDKESCELLLGIDENEESNKQLRDSSYKLEGYLITTDREISTIDVYLLPHKPAVEFETRLQDECHEQYLGECEKHEEIQEEIQKGQRIGLFAKQKDQDGGTPLFCGEPSVGQTI